MAIPILKAYYGKIFFEFLVHKGKKDSIILLEGFPSSNQRDYLMRFFYEKGFNVFFPRFKGSFQSEGVFLETDPVKDILYFIEKIKEGSAKNLWDMEDIMFSTGKINLIGSSFSGAIACGLSASSKEISRLVLASPVLDYEKHNIKGNEQDLDSLTMFVKRAYKNLYRFSFNSIQEKMNTFDKISPNFYLKSNMPPTLIFHDPTDNSVSIQHAREICSKLKNCQLVETEEGHGFSEKLLDKYSKKILNFLRE